MKAAGASVEVQNLVFSKWKEVKHKAEPHNYIEFFLITDTGNEVLAISAEDHGNSHYVYQSTGAFAKYGALNSKTRADTISWLEMIIKESQIKVDSQLAEEVAHAGEPTPDNPLGLYYTQHKAEKTANPDGTHTQRFFLLDQYGIWHLAVVGEERETRDGHYMYKATEEFATRYPLSCHAQKDVIHWLEQRVTHNRTPPPPPPQQQQQRGVNGSGGASAAISAGAGAPSAGSADAWGPSGPSTSAAAGYSSAATPTSAVDGLAGVDGAGLLPQPGDPSLRQLTPSPTAVASGHPQLQPQDALALPDLRPPQHQFLQPQQQATQVPGLSSFSGGGAPGLLPQQQLPLSAAPTLSCGMQSSDGATQGTGGPQPPTLLPALQALADVPPAASSSGQFLSNHAGVLPVQAGQYPAAAHSPTLAPPHPQQQQLLPQNGAQHAPMESCLHQTGQQHQLGPGRFVGSAGHAAATAAAASAPAAALAMELAPSSLQQQLQATGALQQRGVPSAPAMVHPQQDARSQSASVTPPPLQQQQAPFPLLDDPPFQIQQQLSQAQQASQASLQTEPQGLAQLLGLAGLASTMSGGSAAPQPHSNGPPMHLQLPMPPQLQLQGSNTHQLASPLQQSQAQQFMLPNLFQSQQQQQPLLPLQQYNAQTQLQQEQHLQMLQQQIQQQHQQLQQLLQGAPGSFPLNNTGDQQQQQLQPPGYLGVGGQQLSSPGAPLQLSGPALQGLPALPTGGQPWNAGCGPTPAAGGGGQPPAETSALLPSSGQTGMPSPLQLPGLLSGDLSAAGMGANPLATSPAVLPPFGQVLTPLGGGAAAVSGGGTAPARTFGGPSIGGRSGPATGSTGPQGADQVGISGAGVSGLGFGMGAWPTGLGAAAPAGSFPAPANLFPSDPHPHPQQQQLQPFGQPGGAASMAGGLFGAGFGGANSLGAGTGALGPTMGLHSGGGSTPFGFGGVAAAAAGAGAPPASPQMGLPGGFGAAGGAGGQAAGGSAGAGAAGSSLQPPFAASGGQAVAPGMLLPAVRTKEAGPGAGHHGGRGGGGGRGSSGKHKLAGVAEVAHKRKLARLAAAGEEAVRLAQGAYLASLRHQALSEAAQQEALRKTIASWVRGQISEDEVSVSGWHESLEQMLRDANRTHPVSAPFLSSDRLAELTRASAEAITYNSAVSLTAPNNPAAQPHTPAQPRASPPVPARTAAVAAGGMPPAAAGSYPATAAGGCATAGSAGGSISAAFAAAVQPLASIPSSAEQMAALSSLKALLEGNLQAAVLGLTAPPATATADGLQQAAGCSNDAGAGPAGMDTSGDPAGSGLGDLAALTGQPTGDVRMADVSTDPTPSNHGNAAVAAPGAGKPAAAGLVPPSQPAQPPPAPPQPPQAVVPAAPQPAQHQQPTARPTGPVGAAAVVACAGSAKSWSFADPHMNRHGVRIALESLREVAALCPPVASMASSRLVETVKLYESHPHPSVSGLAKEILKRWRGALIHRLRSMSDSRCYQDPVAALESKIQANEIVFPNLNELLGGPRGSTATGAAADGATPSTAAPATAPPGVPYTPSGATPAAAAGFAAVGGNAAYSLAATPTPGGDGYTSAGFPATPPLTLTAAGTPALTTAGTTVTAAVTITPGTGLGVAGGFAPGVTPVATSTAETPRGLFDTATAAGASGVPTPQLFSRPGGAAASLAHQGAGVMPLELPGPTPQPSIPAFPPMSPPAAAPPPPLPAGVVVPPAPPSTAAMAPLPPSPAVALPLPPPSPATAALHLPPAATAQAAMATAAPAPAVPAAGPPPQSQPPTPGQAPALATAPQPSLLAPHPPLAAPEEVAPTGAAALMPTPSLASAPTATPASGPLSLTAMPPSPSPFQAPAVAQAAAAQPPPSPAGPTAATGPAAAAGPIMAAATAPGTAAAAGPATAPPSPPPSGSASGGRGSVALPAFGSPSLLAPGWPQATTAEVAALLAASAQSLAARIQATAAGGSGGSAPPAPPFSPAQLNKLGALASTTKAYASALKTSDPAVAASAWQSMVQQLRQAQQALKAAGLGDGALGALSQRLLFTPSPPSCSAASAASGAAPLSQLPAAWPSINWAATSHAPQAQTLQIQPPPSAQQDTSAGHQHAAVPAVQAMLPRAKAPVPQAGAAPAPATAPWAAAAQQAEGAATAIMEHDGQALQPSAGVSNDSTADPLVGAQSGGFDDVGGGAGDGIAATVQQARAGAEGAAGASVGGTGDAVAVAPGPQQRSAAEEVAGAAGSTGQGGEGGPSALNGLAQEPQATAAADQSV